MASSEESFSPLRKELSKLENYGIVIKNLQKNAGYDDSSQNTINFEAYHRFSRDLMSLNVVWIPLLDLYKALGERTNTEKKLSEIQSSLIKGNLVTVIFFVPQIDDNVLGTVGTHHAPNDSWLLSTKIERALMSGRAELFFHSMIITGYDNEAITVDDEGQKHKGLLTLRSAWGKDAGVHGAFYMSYDYFRVLVLEAQQIVVA
ncbi:MAG: hypothetical protein ACRCXC_07905 [Legionella sp.]